MSQTYKFVPRKVYVYYSIVDSLRMLLSRRYSDLLRLPYFDIIRCHLVDPMHNLFLGTSKRMISLWKEKKYIVESNLDILQQWVNLINAPFGIGRIPSKIDAGFAGFTAEQ